jgi:hypothetical protein
MGQSQTDTAVRDGIGIESRVKRHHMYIARGLDIDNPNQVWAVTHQLSRLIRAKGADRSLGAIRTADRDGYFRAVGVGEARQHRRRSDEHEPHGSPGDSPPQVVHPNASQRNREPDDNRHAKGGCLPHGIGGYRARKTLRQGRKRRKESS